jgi:hypothetical protein
MNSLTKSLVTMAVAAMLTPSVFAQTAKDARGVTPFIPVGDGTSCQTNC